jgi:hypothetical protein
MILAIAIISGIGFLFEILAALLSKKERSVSYALGAVSVISTWTLCFPLAIVILSIGGIIMAIDIFG